MQVLGSLCNICGQKIVFAPDGVACSRCRLPFHKECVKKVDVCPHCDQPLRAAQGTQGVWRSGSLLVMHRNARLPDRCVKTNSAENVRRLKRNLSWHHPGLYLWLLVPPPSVSFISSLQSACGRQRLSWSACRRNFSTSARRPLLGDGYYSASDCSLLVRPMRTHWAC